MLDNSPAVNRPKRLFKIHCRIELKQRPVGKMLSEHSLQHALIARTSRAFGGRCSGVSLTMNVQLCGAKLAHLLDCDVECFSFCLYIENAADNIPFLRSEMKQTFAGFPGNAVLGVFKVKKQRRHLLLRPHRCSRSGSLPVRWPESARSWAKFCRTGFVCL